MSPKHVVRREAVKQALAHRQQLNLAPEQPVSAIDAAQQLGVQVWFRDDRSYDGYYNPGSPPLIVLSSLRPLGRTNFTCAHELGHHVFDHGEQVPETVKVVTSSSAEEQLANTFAAHFLMPRKLVRHALDTRSIMPEHLQPEDVFRIASWLGVGYATVLTQMCYQLQLIGRTAMEELKKCKPARIKQALIGMPAGKCEVIHVDRHWSGRSIDCRIDDFVTSERELIPQGEFFEELPRTSKAFVYRAVKVGSWDCTADEENWRIRIHRGGKTMSARFMYEEELPDD